MRRRWFEALLCGDSADDVETARLCGDSADVEMALTMWRQRCCVETALLCGEVREGVWSWRC